MNTGRHTIYIKTEDRRIPAATGQTLLEAFIEAGIFLRTDCGGKGLCGKCRVTITGDSQNRVEKPDESEKKCLGQTDLATGYRLACRVRVKADLAMDIPDASRLNAEVAQKGLSTLFAEPAGARPAAAQQADVYGLAVDLGTTTIAVYLCNLGTGAVVASTSAKNPQALYGDDVMSRISAIQQDNELLARLQKMAVQAVQWATSSVCRSTGIDPLRITTMTVVGNTTMVHIFAGRDPSTIGVFPYQPAFVDEQAFEAASIGLRFNPKAIIRTLPLITGFIGADIVAAALACELPRAAAGTMLVDLGTNGEIIYRVANGLVATSCATGPALEGAAIRHGMQAVSGAIDAVTIDKTSGRAICSLIQRQAGNPQKAAGICGSGVISAAAQLLRAGIILKDGAFNADTNSPYLQRDDNNSPEFILVPGEQTQDGRPITFTQKDVRAVQLAKGALRTGIDLLCRETGMKQPDKILVAGAFGSFINIADALTLGLFPPVDENNIEVVGNAAGAGATRALFDENFSKHAGELTRQTRVVELSDHPDFQDMFIESLAFP